MLVLDSCRPFDCARAASTFAPVCNDSGVDAGFPGINGSLCCFSADSTIRDWFRGSFRSDIYRLEFLRVFEGRFEWRLEFSGWRVDNVFWGTNVSRGGMRDHLFKIDCSRFMDFLVDRK